MEDDKKQGNKDDREEKEKKSAQTSTWRSGERGGSSTTPITVRVRA